MHAIKALLLVSTMLLGAMESRAASCGSNDELLECEAPVYAVSYEDDDAIRFYLDVPVNVPCDYGTGVPGYGGGFIVYRNHPQFEHIHSALLLSNATKSHINVRAPSAGVCVASRVILLG